MPSLHGSPGSTFASEGQGSWASQRPSPSASGSGVYTQALLTQASLVHGSLSLHWPLVTQLTGVPVQMHVGLSTSLIVSALPSSQSSPCWPVTFGQSSFTSQMPSPSVSGEIVIVTFAVEAVQGAWVIVHRRVTGPAPPVWVNVALGEEALENVPVPPLTTLHDPVPIEGVLPPRPFVVPFAQMVWLPPVVAVEGGWLIVIVTFAEEGEHGALLIVQRTITGPTPLVWVNVELGEAGSEKVPVPPLTTLHAPVPTEGALPPRPEVVPPAHSVCGPPAVAVLGG